MGIGELIIRILYDAHAILEQAGAAPEQLAGAGFADRLDLDTCLRVRYEVVSGDGQGQ